jgi:hypothetical protein
MVNGCLCIKRKNVNQIIIDKDIHISFRKEIDGSVRSKIE